MKSRISLALATVVALLALWGGVGCGGSKNMTEEEKTTPPIDFGTAAPGTPGATAETGPGPEANAPKSPKAGD